MCWPTLLQYAHTRNVSILLSCFMPALRLYTATASNAAARAKTERNTTSLTHSERLERRTKLYVWVVVWSTGVVTLYVDTVLMCVLQK